MGCLGDGGTAEDKELRSRSKQIEKQLDKDKNTYKSTHRLLLLGKDIGPTPRGSGGHYSAAYGGLIRAFHIEGATGHFWRCGTGTTHFFRVDAGSHTPSRLFSSFLALRQNLYNAAIFCSALQSVVFFALRSSVSARRI